MEETNVMNSVSEYKIGNTTYYVETVFNPKGESLEHLIQRLIGKDIEELLSMN